MDEFYMKRALELSKLGAGFTNPNPLVGAVIVKGGEIIGEGYHEYYGGPHAEVNAFKNAKADVKGATMYVTLEPCSHYGKTPPCANAVVEKGIKRVVVASVDSNPLVAGRGIEILKKNGIEVKVGVLEDEARKINEIFIKYITTGMPFCIMKTAMTLDGKIATFTGDSKWITNEESRRHVHRIRQRVSSIMVGIGTVLKDNPYLTTRLEGEKTKNPVRVVVDTNLKIPLNANILDTSSAETIIACGEGADAEKIKIIEEKGARVIITPLKNERVDLSFLFKYLGDMKIDSILLEGGGTLNFTALSEGLIDKVMCFIAPKIIGGRDSKTSVEGRGIENVNDAVVLEKIEISRIRDDVLIEGYVIKR